MDNPTFRMRICFAKTGRLRWLSHLELVRAIERCVRRSGLPFALSQGFNPHLRHAFGPALPVGTASLGEYLDLQLTEYLPAEAVLAQLQAVQVPGLEILAAGYVAKDAPSLAVSLTLADYLIEVRPEEKLPELADRLAALVQAGVLYTAKKGKAKQYDIGQYLVSWSLAGSGLKLTMRSSNEGSLKPEKLLEGLLKECGASIACITRTRLYEPDAGLGKDGASDRPQN